MKDTPETYEAVERWNQGKINIFDEMARLERERDEAIQRRMETILQCELLEKERDEARDDAQKSKAYKRVLKETNARLKRERDEAREEAAHWKTEYEIVVDRLRGRKHPRDNGIIADDEIIPKLERERDEVRDELCHLRACVFDVMSALDAGAFTELRKAWEEGAK